MTSYLVCDPPHTTTIEVESNYITSTGTLLSGLKGWYWPTALAHLEHHGWTIIPIIESSTINEVRLGSRRYELYWNQNRIQRITQYEDDDSEGRDIRYSELPEIIKRML